MNRRRWLTGALTAGAAFLTACGQSGGRLSEQARRMGEGLTRRAQRLLIPANALAPTYDRADISPDFRPNGSIDPAAADYVALKADGFAAYRLVVDELPGPQDEATGIEVRLRYLVPLFVRAPGAAAPDLHCTLAALRLACRNDGGRPAQLGASRLADAGGDTKPLSEGLFGYLLPGTGRHWELDAGRLAGLDGALTLETQINGKPGSVPVQRQP